ncbi:hypothetical protein [Thermococcus sp. 21S9]|uniref:hypothetical protein n=1 Tax=Thermococcus sp. 21S9 TaxID=1638223 RepID=UPI001439451C|nr:hypothetical protein [Thermococcus sp. 21S9]NJE54668.1 hypothetical protein [Thermococcus sp. 21S9]
MTLLIGSNMQTTSKLNSTCNSRAPVYKLNANNIITELHNLSVYERKDIIYSMQRKITRNVLDITTTIVAKVYKIFDTHIGTVIENERWREEKK